MLQFFSFHQSNIHSHVIPHSHPENKPGNKLSPLPSSPKFPKAKNMNKNTYSHLNKYTVQVNDKKSDGQKKDCVKFILNAVEGLVCDRKSDVSDVQMEEELWGVDDSQPSQSSVDSSTSSSSTGTTETESTCSVCEDQTESEDGTPEKKLFNTPQAGSDVLFKDPMLTALPTAWKKNIPLRSRAPKTTMQALHTFHQQTDSLTLGSPSQGLSCSLFPEGQGALESLFEDVWVTPESTVLKTFWLPDSTLDDSDAGRQVESRRHIMKVDRCKKGRESSCPEDHKPLKKPRKVGLSMLTSKKERIPPRLEPKRKCVNGFLMFCRINRRLYIRLCPGMPSTTVTKELANLWRILPKREKRLYCLKACSFSRKQNRNVRTEMQEAELKADSSTPSPLHMLLAYKDVHVTTK